MLAPRYLQALEVTATTVKLQWQAPVSHVAFELQWRIVGGGDSRSKVSECVCRLLACSLAWIIPRLIL